MLVDRLLANPVSIYLSVVGTALLFGAMMLVSRIRLTAGGRAQGQVIDYAERIGSGRGNRRQFMPIVRYHPAGGTPVEFQSRMGASGKPFQIGEPVPVVYRRDKPQVAEIATSAQLWLAPAAIAAMALVALYGAWQAGAPH